MGRLFRFPRIHGLLRSAATFAVFGALPTCASSTPGSTPRASIAPADRDRQVAIHLFRRATGCAAEGVEVKPTESERGAGFLVSGCGKVRQWDVRSSSFRSERFGLDLMEAIESREASRVSNVVMQPDGHRHEDASDSAIDWGQLRACTIAETFPAEMTKVLEVLLIAGGAGACSQRVGSILERIEPPTQAQHWWFVQLNQAKHAGETVAMPSKSRCNAACMTDVFTVCHEGPAPPNHECELQKACTNRCDKPRGRPWCRLEGESGAVLRCWSDEESCRTQPTVGKKAHRSRCKHYQF